MFGAGAVLTLGSGLIGVALAPAATACAWLDKRVDRLAVAVSIAVVEVGLVAAAGAPRDDTVSSGVILGDVTDRRLAARRADGLAESGWRAQVGLNESTPLSAAYDRDPVGPTCERVSIQTTLTLTDQPGARSLAVEVGQRAYGRCVACSLRSRRRTRSFPGVGGGDQPSGPCRDPFAVRTQRGAKSGQGNPVRTTKRPVEALATMRRLGRPDAVHLVMDERGAEAFEPATGSPVERLMYAASVLHCLPFPSAATGTVMRPATLSRFAAKAGFARVDIAPLEHDMFRFYRLIV